MKPTITNKNHLWQHTVTGRFHCSQGNIKDIPKQTPKHIKANGTKRTYIVIDGVVEFL